MPMRDTDGLGIVQFGEEKVSVDLIAALPNTCKEVFKM